MGLRLAVLAAAFASTLASLSAGTITGVVSAHGAAENNSSSGDGAYASRRYKFVERVDYSQLRDFVVHIEGEFPGQHFTPPSQPAVIRQRDANFVPHVLPVLAGTAVEWPNLDDIYHNVFCMAETKPFDLGLYSRDHPPKRVVFDRVGQADVFCSIHSKMHCIVLVFSNPWFAAADERGRYAIHGVPAGTYRLRAWHERLPATVKEVVVPADGEVRVDFELSPGNLPKY